MNPSNYGRTVEIIGQITDPAQLQQMMHNPQYAGFTNIIIARIGEITRMRGAAQGAQQPQPSITAQAMQGGEQGQQLMARGGIVAFKHGGKVRKFAGGTKTKTITNQELYGGVLPEVSGWHAPDNYITNPQVDPLADTDWPTNNDPYSTPIKAAGHAGKELVLSVPRGIRSGLRGLDNITTGIGNAFRSQENQRPYTQEPGQRPAAVAIDPSKVIAQSLTSAGQKTLPPAMTAEQILRAAQGGSYNSDITGAGSSSIRSSSGGRGSGDGDKVKTLAEYMAERDAALGANKESADERKDLEKQKAGAFDQFLMRAGLGMANAATTHPQGGILGAGAAGATEGLTGYTAEAAARNKQLSDLRRADRAEQVAGINGAIAERGQDVRAQIADRRQAQAINSSASIAKAQLNAGYMQQKAAQQYAAELAVRDTDPATGKPRQPFGAYLALAMQSGIVPSAYSVSARSDSSTLATKQKVYNEAEKLQPGSGLQAVQRWEAMQQGGATGTATGTNRGSLS